MNIMHLSANTKHCQFQSDAQNQNGKNQQKVTPMMFRSILTPQMVYLNINEYIVTPMMFRSILTPQMVYLNINEYK